MLPARFSNEVIEYMTANGYLVNSMHEPTGSMYFRNGSKEVVFWQDKIECRPLVNNVPYRNHKTTAFKGFDGKDMFRLMLILHLMGAIDMKDVQAMVKDAVPVEEVLMKEFNLNLQPA